MVALPLHLEVPTLGAEEVLDVALGVSGEAQHEVPLDLELVDGLNRLMDLQVERHVLSPGQAEVGEAGRGRGGGLAAVPWKGSPQEGGVGRAPRPKGRAPPRPLPCPRPAVSAHVSPSGHRRVAAPGSSPTLLSRALISCWLAVDSRKLLICPFRGSSTSTSMS